VRAFLIAQKGPKTRKTIRRKVSTNIVPIFGSFNAKHVVDVICSVFTIILNEGKYVPFTTLHDIVKAMPTMPYHVRRVYEKLYKLFHDVGWTTRQLFHLIISIARFIIVDDTVPSGAILELGYARNAGTITIVLAARARHRNSGEIAYRSTGMTYDFDIHSADVKVFEYDWKVVETEQNNGNTVSLRRHLKGILNDAFKWANKRFEMRKKELEKRSRKYVSILDREKGALELSLRSMRSHSDG